ncbi:hypothetical protein [Aquaticitalea lipolytica]|uniref:hypothetical protein n=1 Tax=Aquaticitalea lipolytica TaxID=1247562 RepID=UPI0024B9EAB5|nr:hypothetical protein [Aquaticitalea lipolytica]
MNFKQLILLVAFSIGFVTQLFSQHGRYNIYNGFSIGGGVTQFNVLTDNFETQQGNGWVGTMSATVDIPHKWHTVSYLLQLSENSFGVSSRALPSSTTSEMVEYKLMTAQVAFLIHAKIVKNNFTIDIGPMLQYNGKLDLKDKSKENYFIDGYSALQAKEIIDISKFNVNGAIGATAGFNHFKLRVQYVYGVTNMLKKLNDQDLNTDPSNKSFKGNQSMFTFSAIAYF